NMNGQWSAESLAAQALGDVDAASGAITPAIHPSTSYERNPDGTYRSGLAYTRSDNPTYDHAEKLLTTLESGASCMLFASGSAAATAVFQALLPGDHVLVSRVLYWGVRQWLAHFGVAWGLDVEFIDPTDLPALSAAVRPGRTRLMWLETPANPLWDVTDLDAAVRIAHAADVRVAVDNTVATPVLTRPIDFGVDIAARQMSGGFSGMLSIRVAGGEREAMTVGGSATLFKRGTSLGGVESLIEHRKSTEGASSPVPDDLLRLSIGLETPDDLITDL